MNTWIKRSDREPTKDETPVMYGRYKGEEWLETSAQYGWPASLNIEYNYWRSIKVPPPPRELTQRERDNSVAQEAAEWSYNNPDEAGSYAVVSARYAIYAERREVKELMAQYFGGDLWGKREYSCKEISALRARLDEQGGGK